MNTPDIIYCQEKTSKNAQKAEANRGAMPGNIDWVPRAKPARSAHPDLQHLIDRKGSLFAGWR
ncbi:MAG: hypothetical protein U0989_14335 [Azonexus sp.]|nr:hypothetical protein [Azonexus sp.]MDP3638322.1 hypothetical protein [Azonexus sp.]MDZ4315933.1 hypothetical protein [Azonexus sp.]